MSKLKQVNENLILTFDKAHDQKKNCFQFRNQENVPLAFHDHCNHGFCLVFLPGSELEKPHRESTMTKKSKKILNSA